MILFFVKTIIENPGLLAIWLSVFTLTVVQPSQIEPNASHNMTYIEYVKNKISKVSKITLSLF